MQFDQAGTIVRRVRWFFAGPEAKPFSVPITFGSANYGKIAGGTNGPGEVWSATRVWNDGHRPDALKGIGSQCGSLDWWQNGVPAGTPPLEIVAGTPRCCGFAGYDGRIGAKAALSGSIPCGVGVDCRLATSFVCPVGTFFPPATGFCSYGGDVIRDSHGFFQFAVFHQDGCIGCLRGLWQGNFAPLNEQIEAPLAGYWQGDHSQLVFIYPIDKPVYGGTLWIVRFSLPPQMGKIGAKAGFKGQTHLVIERVEIGAKAGLTSFVHTRELATVGAQAGLASTSHGLYSGALGGEAGLESAFTVMVAAELGAEAGLASDLEAFASGALGVEAGLESVLVTVLAGDLGGKVGLAGAVKGRLAATVGGKAGLASLERIQQPATAGCKVGLTSQLKSKGSFTVGAKGGLASNAYPATLTNCCPGNAIPATLTGDIGGGTPFTMTFNSGTGFWSGLDTGTGFTVSLQCHLVSGSFVWDAFLNTVGSCTRTQSLRTVTCFPFAFSQRLVYSGGSCVTPGTFNIHVHA